MARPIEKPTSGLSPAALTQLDRSVRQAAQLLQSSPGAALDTARNILTTQPGFPPALFLEGQALRRVGRVREALAKLKHLAQRQPGVPAIQWELAQSASEDGDSACAIAVLEELTRKQPKIANGWFLLARELRKAGRSQEAWRADLSGVHASSHDPGLLKAAIAMQDSELDDAESLLRARLATAPDDAPANRLLGEVRWRQGDITEAMELVQRAVEIAPGFDLAREFLIRLLQQSNHLVEAMEHVELLGQSPIQSNGHELLKASLLVRLGEQAQAGEIYEKLLAEKPDLPQLWQNLGHVHKTLGKQAKAIEAYREAVTRQPSLGEAWWSLANLKTVKLDQADIATMERALATLSPSSDEAREDIFHLHFALGKAHEDAGDYADSFQRYDEGNRLRRTMLRYNADDFAAEIKATAEAFSDDLLERMGPGGFPAKDPIFIVGLPRSGSTLVEQILSSHSQIEGTMELPEMMMIAARLQSRVDAGEFPDFSAMLTSLTPHDRQRLGEEYIERTSLHRHTDRPLFIDKMPNNWQHVGLIKLILPNARIIDVRRNPMSCCFSGWKQHFARGQAFSYDLTDIGRYYRNYVDLMAVYEAAIPGFHHRIHYEDLVTNTETEIRRLLDFLALPFEEACLEFHRNERAVRTASSEQVRQPIFTSGIDQWKHYGEWLDPLVEALG